MPRCDIRSAGGYQNGTLSISLPTTMHAAFVDALGPAESIRYGLLPVPTPADGDVLIRSEAMAVNHVDLFVRSGAYRTPMTFPFIIGRDVVGTVFVGGAGGAVGSAAVQLAAHLGARVVAAASAGDADWVRSCGAEAVLDSHDADFAASGITARIGPRLP